MFIVLQADSPWTLAESSGILLLLLLAMPLVFLALGRWILPHAPGSEFALLVTVAIAAAFVTERLGVELLLGAFLCGLVAHLLSRRLPRLASEHNMHAVKLFSNFFLPFYFSARARWCRRAPSAGRRWQSGSA